MANTSPLQSTLTALLPENELSVAVGEYSFRQHQNQPLMMALLERYARENKQLISYQQFLNLRDPSLQPSKPTKPIKDDPRYQDPTKKALFRQQEGHHKGNQKYRVYLIWKHQQQLKKYYARLQEYEVQQTHLQFIRQTYRSEHRGYINYAFATLSESDQAFFLRRQSFRINEWARQRHSYVTGQSGSGKTELLKVFIHHYLTKSQRSAVILLDPHGDIAQQVAQFKENADSDRLAYIDPFLDKDHIPVINPFFLPAKADYTTIDLITQEIYGVFREVLKANFTQQMETVLKPCITTLLMMGGKDINDLQRFMDDDRNSEYISYGVKHLYNPSQVEFLRTDFHKDTYNPTKQAIKTKIQSLLNAYTFRQLLTGKPTFDLVRLVEQKKLIVFNLSTGKMGADTSDIVGRFLLAQIKSMAFARADQPEDKRTHTHLFIDECQRYLSPSIKTILTESRKYKLFLTLANQYYGQDMTTDLKDAITNNTAVKIAGKNGDKNANTHHKETGADSDELKSLKVGEFHIKEDVKPSVKVKAPKHVLKSSNAMTSQQWETVKAEQLALYYRSLVAIDPEADTIPAKPTHNSQKPPEARPTPPHTPRTPNIKPKLDIEL